MSTVLLDAPMAKTRKPKTEQPTRKDSPIRIDEDALAVARIVAAYRKLHISTYISQIVREVATRDHREEVSKVK